AHALGAPQAVGGVRLDDDDRARLDLDHVAVQFHLAPAFEDVVHLGAFAVVVLHRVGDVGDVQVAGRRVGARQRPGALAARARDSGGVRQAADEIAFAGGRRGHGIAPESGARAGPILTAPLRTA